MSHTISVSCTFYHEVRKVTTESGCTIRMTNGYISSIRKTLGAGNATSLATANADYYFKLLPFCTVIPLFPYLRNFM